MTANTRQKPALRKISTILVSQPKPAERSPYYKLEEKYGLTIDWRPFIHVEGVEEKEFRRTRIKPDEYSSVIFTSKNSIENYFRICEEMRIKVDPSRKYFCMSESIANYLHKFIQYRKRKVFFGERLISDLAPALDKHKKKTRFLLPCSNLGAKDVVDYLQSKEFDFQEAMMYRTVSSDLSDLSDITYDVLVFFSPLGIQSLFDNFPDFKQNNTRIAAFGNSTCQAVSDAGLELNIKAPADGIPSMTTALEKYLKISNE